MVGTYFTPIHVFTCRKHSCSLLGPITLFFFLCSNGYFAASIADLYQSVSNPFSSPHALTHKLHGVVLLLCGTITLIITYTFNSDDPALAAFSYRADVQFCWITPVSGSAVNPLNTAFIYVPVCLIIVAAFSVNVYAFLRLRKGLPDTFAIRNTAVQDSFSYSVAYTLYVMPMAVCYFTIWFEDRAASDADLVSEEFTHNREHKIFAVLLGALGINDYVMWYCRKCSKRELKQLRDERMMEMATLSRNMNAIDEEMDLDEERERRERKRRKRKQKSTIKSHADLKQVVRFCDSTHTMASSH